MQVCALRLKHSPIPFLSTFGSWLVSKRIRFHRFSSSLGKLRCRRQLQFSCVRGNHANLHELAVALVQVGYAAGECGSRAVCVWSQEPNYELEHALVDPRWLPSSPLFSRYAVTGPVSRLSSCSMYAACAQSRSRGLGSRLTSCCDEWAKVC